MIYDYSKLDGNAGAHHPSPIRVFQGLGDLMCCVTCVEGHSWEALPLVLESPQRLQRLWPHGEVLNDQVDTEGEETVFSSNTEMFEHPEDRTFGSIRGWTVGNSCCHFTVWSDVCDEEKEQKRLCVGTGAKRLSNEEK